MQSKLLRHMKKVGEVGMTYKRGQVSISVHQLDGFGKNPALWIGTEKPNQMVKVASFGNERKARLFCKWLEYLIGLNNDEGSVKWDETDKC